ncbi:MAG: hypothetical protein IJX44_08605 [Bacteroidaceae bacterium]|nr:hypothetical protein [Bacteroidaceae bacterium]
MKALRVLGIAASLSLGFASSLLAQDVLITQEGDAYKVYEIEIGGSSIFYKLESTPEAAIQKIDKSQVLMIKYQDGRKVIMGEETNRQAAANGQPSQGQSQKQPMAFTPEEEAEIAALNAKLVEEYNQQRVEYTKPKNKKASLLFCTFGLKKDTRLQDKNVKITFQAGTYYSNSKKDKPAFRQNCDSWNPGIQVTVENISTKTVYLDLGNSFFIRNGEASPYYVPSATSTTSGSSGGASVNLGSVADALGVGGIVGTLAGGVNVGGGKSSSSSTVTYSQRVVSIPAKAKIQLDFQQYMLSNRTYWKVKTTEGNKNGENCISTAPERIEIKRGEVITYTEADETLSCGVRVAYSFDESCQQANTLYADMYLKEILGCKMNPSGSRFDIRKDELSPNWKDALHVVIRNF